MPLSRDWNTANEIYKPKPVYRDLNKLVYRYGGSEAFVIKETEDSYQIQGLDGDKCWIWKHTSKSRIYKVSNDYKLRY